MDELKLKIEKRILYSDSSTIIQWIKTKLRIGQTFVVNWLDETAKISLITQHVGQKMSLLRRTTGLLDTVFFERPNRNVPSKENRAKRGKSRLTPWKSERRASL